MILPGNATLILSAVRHLVTLSRRIDGLMAQRTAVNAQLVLGMPALRMGNAQVQLALATQALAETAGRQPDPFGADRPAFEQQVAQPDGGFDALFAKYFPDQISALVISPDAAYLAQLQQAYPGLDWNDPGVRIAACAVAAGPDDRQISYSARVALAVADTLLEFGAENTALIVRDDKLRGLVQSVLEKFAQPDWAGFDSWNPLLQTALKITLNSALDVTRQLPAQNPWLDGVFDALAQARAAAPDPDNYLLGLLQGQGVPLLLSQGLLVASDRLDDDQAAPFKLIAADVLAAAAPYVRDQTNPGLGQFFRDHWGDLLRAGLTSLDKHGDKLLDPGQPLLNGVLHAMVQQLATTPNAAFLTSDTLHHLADAAIDVVAAHPDQLPGLDNQPWLRDFIASAAQTVSQLTTRKLFTAAAADALLRDAFGVLAKNPGLVISGNGLPLTLVGSVFTALSDPSLSRLDIRSVGETIVRSSLTALAADPALASTAFGPVVTAVATQLAGCVGQGTFTAEQASAVASAAIDAIARNPQIYAGAQNRLAATVVSAAQQAFPAGAAWAGRLLAGTVRETLLAFGRNGASTAGNRTVDQVGQLLTTILSGALQTAVNQLGAGTDLDSIPPIVGGLVSQALKGEIADFTPNSAQLTAAIKTLAAQA